MTPVGKYNVKICALCGTLNHQSNGECWICRWHGAFSQDAQTIALAWQRLELLYEEVRLEHVTSSRLLLLDDFGAMRSPKGLRALLSACRKGWQHFQSQRDLRSAQREASLRHRVRSRRDQLGV